MNKSDKILVLGSNGMLGHSIIEKLRQNFSNIINPGRSTLNLLIQQDVNEYFNAIQPDYVFLCAAKVGGILNNLSHPAEFGYENGMIALNVIHAAHKSLVKKLLFLGSSCIYPKLCQQPMDESSLLSGYLEPTNEMYALSKILGLKLCDAYRKEYGCNFISCMPTNLYGPYDNFSDTGGHVIPALIKRFHKAKINGESTVSCWGSGNQKREFMFVSDCADACVFLMDRYNEAGHINVGIGQDHTMREIAEMIKNVVGYTGEIIWDTSKPDGTPQKLLNVSKINALGWKSQINIQQGLEETYNWFKGNYND